MLVFLIDLSSDDVKIIEFVIQYMLLIGLECIG